MADNFWMVGDNHDLPSLYNFPTDLSFLRDIDPTVLRRDEIVPLVSDTENAWTLEPAVSLEHVSEPELTKWPFEQTPSSNIDQLVIRRDLAGVDWLVV